MKRKPVKKVESTRAELEMKLTSMLDKLGVTLDELDASALDCGCCHTHGMTDLPNYWPLAAEIDGLRFLLDV